MVGENLRCLGRRLDGWEESWMGWEDVGLLGRRLGGWGGDWMVGEKVGKKVGWGGRRLDGWGGSQMFGEKIEWRGLRVTPAPLWGRCTKGWGEPALD